MDLKPFFSCTLFEDINFVPKPKFTISQSELRVKSSLNNQKYLFDKIEVEYRCEWISKHDWKKNLPAIIIPIRDNVELLKFTGANFKEHRLDEIGNIIVVDDRSEENIKEVALEYDFSYLRVDNDKGFNFSMLNNIAAKVAHSLGCSEIVCWNSDLWCVDREYFIELLKRHKESNSMISGSKLLYPPLAMSKVLSAAEDTQNIKAHFSHMSGGKWRETVQFGGDRWVRSPDSPIMVSPLHYMRFAKATDSRVNCDRGASFLTGALHVWNLDFFILAGGFNPSLSKNFQDVDLCLRSLEKGSCPMYFGKDIYFYHDESFNFYNNSQEEKYDQQLYSDHVLFGKIWNDKIVRMVW